MIAGALIGLLGGGTMGLCVAPLWMMLQLPMRTDDILNAGGSMRLYALALTIGATAGTFHGSLYCPQVFGVAALFLGGVFVGMLAAALTEALEVVPALLDRLSVTADMRFAAAAMAIGKTAGAVIAGLLGV